MRQRESRGRGFAVVARICDAGDFLRIDARGLVDEADENVDLLRRVSQCLKPGGQVAIWEIINDATPSGTRLAFDLTSGQFSIAAAGRALPAVARGR